MANQGSSSSPHRESISEPSPHERPPGQRRNRSNRRPRKPRRSVDTEHQNSPHQRLFASISGSHPSRRGNPPRENWHVFYVIDVPFPYRGKSRVVKLRFPLSENYLGASVQMMRRPLRMGGVSNLATSSSASMTVFITFRPSSS